MVLFLFFLGRTPRGKMGLIRPRSSLFLYKDKVGLTLQGQCFEKQDEHGVAFLRKLFPGSGSGGCLCANATRPDHVRMISLVSKLQNGLEFHLWSIRKLVWKRLQLNVIFCRRCRRACGLFEWTV